MTATCPQAKANQQSPPAPHVSQSPTGPQANLCCWVCHNARLFQPPVRADSSQIPTNSPPPSPVSPDPTGPQANLCCAAQPQYTALSTSCECRFSTQIPRFTPPPSLSPPQAHRPTFAVLRRAHLNSLPPDQQQGVPSTPGPLTARIQQLMELERHIPGLDVLRIFKTL